MSGIPVNTTLLIGLGGQGQSALAAVKRRMKEAYNGEIPPVIRFLALDTTVLDERNARDLDKDEFHHLSVQNVADYISDRREELSTWLDIKNIPWDNLRNIRSGAGQIRAVGRLALKFHMRDVLSLIQANADAVRSEQATLNPKWEISTTSPQVIFFGSTAGGTGSGTILDLACATRQIVGQNWDICAYLMLPGVFIGLPSTFYIEENSYAFLKELDFFMAEREAIESGEHGDLFTMATTDGVGYTFSNPFNKIVLIDNVTQAENETVYKEPSDLARAVGEALYATTGGPIGKDLGDTLANPHNQGHPWDGGKKCWYSGLGVAVLRYPRAELVAYGERAFIANLVNRLQAGEPPAEGGTSSDPAELAGVFKTTEKIQQLGDKQNQILEQILPAVAFNATIPALITKDVEIEPVWQANQSLLADKIGEWNKTSASNRELLVARVHEALSGQIDDLVCRYGGGVARRFAVELRAYFGSVRDELTKQNVAAGNRARLMEGAVTAKKGECAERTRKVFGKKEAVTRVLAEYRATLGELAKAHGEQARTYEGINFCAGLTLELDRMIEALDSQRAAQDNLHEKAARERDNALETIRTSRPFERLVYPDLDELEVPAPLPSDFYAWYSEKEQSSVLGFWLKSTADAYACLEEYARFREVSAKLTEASLADAMKQKSEAERDEILRMLDRAAEALLSVDKGKIQGHPDKDSVEPIYIIAADKAFRSVFDDEKVAGSTKGLATRLQGLGVARVEGIDLADPDRAYFYRRWGCVPAYALNSFKLLKSEYTEMASKSDQWSLHLDKRWGAVLPDLDRSSGAEADLWVWALAASDIEYLQRVKRAANFYTLVYDRVLDDGKPHPMEIPLGNGLATARSAFLSKTDWVAQCQEHILGAIKQQGDAAALQDLEAYEQRLMAEVDRADESRKALLDQELTAVARYIAKIR